VTGPAVDDRVVLRDAFPAEVTRSTDGVVWRSARAVITRSRVYVWVAQGREPLLVLDEPYDPAGSTVPAFNARPGDGSHLTLTAGGQVHINRQRGCGCGNPLKAWQPWRPYRVGVA
jgi:hypothetical protein